MVHDPVLWVIFAGFLLAVLLGSGLARTREQRRHVREMFRDIVKGRSRAQEVRD